MCDKKRRRARHGEHVKGKVQERGWRKEDVTLDGESEEAASRAVWHACAQSDKCQRHLAN